MDRSIHLETQLARDFDMKDLGSVKQILGIRIHRDRNNRKLRFSQKTYMEKVLQCFNMQNAQPVSTPFLIHIKLSSDLCPSTEAKKTKMSHLPYNSRKSYVCHGMH